MYSSQMINIYLPPKMKLAVNYSLILSKIMTKMQFRKSVTRAQHVIS